ncbi:MAG: acetolactate synthase small subunit [Bacteroidaceae bacterium]|nr:acetolactate synthase small subunit [Bacteroidaceae bacterium]
MEKKLFTLIVYSENIAGLLNQVTAEFTRRQMNIETLNVSSSSIENVHRYTITVFSDEETIQKVTKRIEKKIDVVKADYYTDQEIFMQEVALYKISTTKMLSNRQVSRIIRHSNARVLEMNSAYVLVEKTGKTEDIIALYKEFVAEQCLLQYVKSGRVAITRDFNEDLSEQLFNEDAKRKGINK